MTSLHILAAKNFEFNKKIAELFLHAGADPNVKDFYGRTPLIVAAGSLASGLSCYCFGPNLFNAKYGSIPPV